MHFYNTSFNTLLTTITTDRVNARDMSQTGKRKQDYGSKKSREPILYSFSPHLKAQIILDDSTAVRKKIAPEFLGIIKTVL